MDRRTKLYELKLKRLEEQRKISLEMNAVCKEFSESNKRVRKNLEVAISVSKRPGYFTYYEPETKILEAERDKVLGSFVSKIKAVEVEIESIDQQLAQDKTNMTSKPKEIEIKGEVNSLNEWFAVYGKPETSLESDKISQFLPSPKIYGGTSHHRAFKSQATIIQKGRATM